MASDNFQKCLALVLKYEGGKSDSPHDPGGRTNEGITQATYNAYLAKHNRPSVDVFNIPNQDRDAIYKTEFWDIIQGDVLPRGLDMAIFDFAVNSGPARALEFYHEIARLDTIAAIKAICSLRLQFMRSLRGWKYFGPGWRKRVNDCQTQALVMAGAPAQTHIAPAATGASGAFLAAIGGLIHYLWGNTHGHVVFYVQLLVIIGTVLMMIAFTHTKVKQPTNAHTHVPVPVSPEDKLKALLDQRADFLAKIDPMILVAEIDVKASITSMNDLLGQIPPVIIAPPQLGLTENNSLGEPKVSHP